MFLKVLWEHKRPGGRFTSNSWGVDSILASTLAFFFELENPDAENRRWTQWALTTQEREDALLGIEELQRSGFLRDDPGQRSPNFKLLTEKGAKYAAQELAKMTLPSVNIEEVISRDDLLDLVRDDFINGQFEFAIMKAFKQVEVAVRAKAKQSASMVGQDLMAAAFSVGKGVLKHPDAQTTSEEQALFFLFAGSNGWFRNPTHHRNCQYDSPHEAAQILALANLLLDMVDKCK
jgi:uncharacterized protein (TIGR02391 family)